MPFLPNKFLISFLILWSLKSNADFQAYQIAPCRFWMASNANGFVCQNYPATINVPRAESIAKSLRELNERIVMLEKKVNELELTCKRP